MARKTKMEMMHNQLNEEFIGKIDAWIERSYGVKARTKWNIFSMNLSTMREDGGEFTPEQLAGIGGYSEGYAAAMAAVFWKAQEEADKRGGHD